MIGENELVHATDVKAVLELSKSHTVSNFKTISANVFRRNVDYFRNAIILMLGHYVPTPFASYGRNSLPRKKLDTR